MPSVAKSCSVSSIAYASTDELAPRKEYNKILRWNLVWFFLICLAFVPLPLWLYPIYCFAGYLTICSVTGWTCLVLFCCMVCATRSVFRLYMIRHRLVHHCLKDCVAPNVAHMVLMAGYKEPLDVMFKTLDTLSSQTMARRLFVVIALEARTPDVSAKCTKLKERYESSFLHLMFTVHPFGVEGEIPGKCSNANYATRLAVQELKAMNICNPDCCTFTTCDTDNLFPPDYFERLTYEFLTNPDRDDVIWQPPLFYNYDLDKRPFFVRVTGILRAIFIVGMLIPQNVNAMSVYSMSLTLLEKGDYFHPMYQFVDAIDNLVRMIAIKKTVRLIFLPCPVISGPTSGVNLRQEIVEWARQAWRWCIGTTEIFHYFCIKFCRFRLWSAVKYGCVFTHYYGFFLCGMALFCVTGIISVNSFNAAGVCVPSKFLPYAILNYVPLFGIAFAYVMFAWAFVLDALATKLLGIKEDIGICRNVLHWLSSPFVLLAYSAICYFAIVELAVRGKKVCTHGASKKDGLGVPQV